MEELRNNKMPVDYKFTEIQNGFIFVSGTSTFELFDGKGLPEPETPLIYRCEHHTESGHITKAMIQEVRKRLKK